MDFGVCVLAVAMLGWAPVAEAQFFWSPFFQQEQPKRQKVRPAKPKTPADDLPPIIPRESSTPPPPDDRPYDAKLMRLAEILGAVHYLRELCGAQEGQLWRDQMKEIVRNEGSTAVRRAKLVDQLGAADGSGSFVLEDFLHLVAPELTLLRTAQLTEVMHGAEDLGEPHQFIIVGSVVRRGRRRALLRHDRRKVVSRGPYPRSRLRRGLRVEPVEELGLGWRRIGKRGRRKPNGRKSKQQ